MIPVGKVNSWSSVFNKTAVLRLMIEPVMRLFTLAVCLFIAKESGIAFGARILGLFTIPSISHQIVYRSLMRELHARGHQLLVFTPDPIKDPTLKNYTEIDLSASYDVWRKRFDSLTKTRDKGISVPLMLIDFVHAGLDLCDVELNLPEVKEFMKGNDKEFDVVIAEWVMSPCFAVIPHKIGAPLMGISSVAPSLTVHSVVGNPVNPAYTPDILLGYTDHPTFLERIYSTLHTTMVKFVYHFWIIPAHDAVVRKIFPDIDMPFIQEVINNVSVILVNSHYSFYYPRPNVPTMVEIAGLHLSDPKPLPKDLQEFMDGAVEGVIYFSLGTNVRSDSMSDTKRQMFLDAFSELKHFRVLWKWEGDEIPGLPENVQIRKWLPQQDVLAHPKVKAFIYQGGLQSTEETIRVQVPVIGIPFFADQVLNVRKMVHAGAGVRLDFKDISKESLLNALNEVIYNPIKMESTISISVFAVIWLSTIESARILGVFPVPSISHQVVYRALFTELNSRGHEIVIVTTDPLNNSSLKNYREIDIRASYKVWGDKFNFLKNRVMGATRKDFMNGLLDISEGLCTGVFDNAEVKKLMRTNKERSFDLVMVEWLVTPCTYTFAYHFSAPLVGISPLVILYSGYESVGNPVHPIYFSEALCPALKNPTIWDKIERISYFIWYKWYWYTITLVQDEIARRYLGSSMPYLGDLEKNVSLVFTNVPTSNHFVVPKVPALVELGQMHFQEVKPLPKDLQDFLDEATEGVIYFSLGTNVRSDSMSQEQIQIFNDVFSQLVNFRVLWKFEGDILLGKPNNVKISKWFPQQDILAHTKIKAVIYQGGLQSTEEAIRMKVPVLGFPIFGDQDLNVQMVVDNGIGEMLYIDELTREKLLSTLKKLIYDPKYVGIHILDRCSRTSPPTRVKVVSGR
ncbi:hypothetical protein C0J52_23089 [Blattella germanica]|nr:hypothetical protein C0J52_23089 [Blattella germanica]